MSDGGARRSPVASAIRVKRLGRLSAGMVAVVVLLAVAINSAALTALDRSVWAWFDVHQSPSLHVDSTGAFRYVGRPLHVASAGVLCGALLATRARSLAPAVLVIGGVGIGVIAEQVLKATVGRIADIAPMYPADYHHSFPSGHVTGCATLLGLTAVCLGAGRSRMRAAVLTSLVLAGVLVVALLALYSYSHTFTDVLGGMALGGAIVAAGAALWASNRGHRPGPARSVIASSAHAWPTRSGRALEKSVLKQRNSGARYWD